MLVDPEQWQSSQLNSYVTPNPQRSLPLPDALGSSISSLDQTMQNILTTPSNDAEDAYNKAQLYSQAFQRYLTFADKYRDKSLGKFEMVQPKQTFETLRPTTTSIKSNDTDKMSNNPATIEVKRLIKQTLPPTLRGKGEALLEHLANLPGVSWDSKQQLILDDKTIDKSNVVDLVDDLVRDRKTIKPPPKGWDELADVLTKTNIPKALIGNSTRRHSLMQDRLSRADRPLKRKQASPRKLDTNQTVLNNWIERR